MRGRVGRRGVVGGYEGREGRGDVEEDCMGGGGGWEG